MRLASLDGRDGDGVGHGVVSSVGGVSLGGGWASRTCRWMSVVSVWIARGELGVRPQLPCFGREVVVGLGSLELRLAVLADHDERRQEDRLERDDQGQPRPRIGFDEQHPDASAAAWMYTNGMEPANAVIASATRSWTSAARRAACSTTTGWWGCGGGTVRLSSWARGGVRMMPAAISRDEVRPAEMAVTAMRPADGRRGSPVPSAALIGS